MEKQIDLEKFRAKRLKVTKDLTVFSQYLRYKFPEPQRFVLGGTSRVFPTGSMVYIYSPTAPGYEGWVDRSGDEPRYNIEVNEWAGDVKGFILLTASEIEESFEHFPLGS